MADEGSRLVEELMRFKPDRLTANAWAVQAGVSRTIWADLGGTVIRHAKRWRNFCPQPDHPWPNSRQFDWAGGTKG